MKRENNECVHRYLHLPTYFVVFFDEDTKIFKSRRQIIVDVSADSDYVLIYFDS